MAETIQSIRADLHLHRLYAEHAMLPVGVVTQCAQNHAPMVQAAWQELPGAAWADRAEQFFTQGEECLFDLLCQDTTREARLHQYEVEGTWQWLQGAGRDVLDFGGGLGLTSSLLADAGKQVTYVDVDGSIARFASWYFAQAGHTSIAVRHTSPRHADLPAGRSFDLVLAEHVLEYLADPVATIEALAAATAEGGLLHLRLDPRQPSAAEPDRLEVALGQLLQGSPTLRAMEHVQRSDDGRHLFRR